jgi:hypothetical protein
MEYYIYYEIYGALMRPVTACSGMNFIVTAENRRIIQPNNDCGRLARDSPTLLVEACNMQHMPRFCSNLSSEIVIETLLVPCK